MQKDSKTAQIAAALTTIPKLQVIKALAPGPVRVSAIVESTGIPQAIVSQTLNQLRNLGIVSRQPKGTERIYKIDRPEILEVIKIIESLN